MPWTRPVIYKTPGKAPAAALIFLLVLALATTAFVLFLIMPELSRFGSHQDMLRVQSSTFACLGVLFIPLVCCSMLLAAVRRNTVNQMPEVILLVVAGLVVLGCIPLSRPELRAWASIHGYALDHVEPARHGSWYVFRRNSQP